MNFLYYILCGLLVDTVDRILEQKYDCNPHTRAALYINEFYYWISIYPKESYNISKDVVYLYC